MSVDMTSTIYIDILLKEHLITKTFSTQKVLDNASPVHKSPSTRFKQWTTKNTNIVLCAVTRVWVIAKFFWTVKVHSWLATCTDTGSSLLALTWFCNRNK
jgi:hypothetical protein